MIKLIYLSIKNNKIRTLLLLFLTLPAIILCLTVMTNYFSYKTQKKLLNNLYGENKQYIYRLDFKNVENFDSFAEDIEKIKKYVREEYSAKCAGFFQMNIVMRELVNNEEFYNSNMKIYRGSFDEIHARTANVILVEPEIFDFLCNDSKLNVLKEEKSNYKELPILVGSDYEGIIEEGAILTADHTGEKYKVIGFIKDIKWFNSDDSVDFAPQMLNHSMVAPFSKSEYKDNSSQMSTVGKIFIFSKEKEQSVCEGTKRKAKEYGVRLSVNKIDSLIYKWEVDHIEYIKTYFFFMSIVTICVLISMSTFFLATAINSKKEIGIKLAFGMFKKKILLLQTAEYFIIIFFSYILGIIIKKIEYHNISKSKQIYLITLNKISIPITLVFIIVLLAYFSFITNMLLSKYSPGELIRGEE